MTDFYAKKPKQVILFLVIALKNTKCWLISGLFWLAADTRSVSFPVLIGSFADSR